MSIMIVHGFHRLSSFLSGQKGTKEPPEPRGSGPPAIPPGFLNGAAIHGISIVNYIRLPVATAVLHPCKEAALFDVVSQMAGRDNWVKNHKKRKKKS